MHGTPTLALVLLVALAAAPSTAALLQGKLNVGAVNIRHQPRQLMSLVLTTCTTTPLRVTLRVFSGVNDPSWVLSASQADVLSELVSTSESVNKLFAPVATTRVMGYMGFVVSCDGDTRGVVVTGMPLLELFLLGTGEEGSQPLRALPQVVSHVRESVGQHNPLIDVSQLAVLSGLDEGACQAPVVGPDTPPVYDPKTDDGGCFVTDCSLNNCYAYGTDIATDTFPQPGRGSGQKWSANTCTDMGAASVRDGLVFNGTALPQGNPAKGHFVALLIWPDTNFHWIRKDANGYWSHKPGGTPVRNVDNNNEKITDPSKSDFSPWTQFCAYYVAQPSKLKIQ